MAKKQDFVSLIGAKAEAADTVEIDRYDLAILRLLSADSRHSQRALAREVGLSPSSIAERVARLEATGVIRRYGVDIDWALLGYDTVVFALFKLSTGHSVGAVAESLRRVVELEQLWIATGRFELIARFRLQGTEHLRVLLTDELWTIPGVAKVETSIALAQLVDEPLSATLLDEESLR